MLHRVPKGVNALTRNVVINHPNCFLGEVWRKEILRKDPGETPGVMAGDPTWGGMGQLDDADEENYEYKFVGYAYSLRCDTFAPAPLMDRNDMNTDTGDKFTFVIIPAEDTYGAPGYFQVKTHDILFLLVCLDENSDEYSRIAFEVVGRETVLNIPPYCARYTVNRRDDLHFGPDNEPLFDVRELKKAQNAYKRELSKKKTEETK